MTFRVALMIEVTFAFVVLLLAVWASYGVDDVYPFR